MSYEYGKSDRNRLITAWFLWLSIDLSSSLSHSLSLSLSLSLPLHSPVWNFELCLLVFNVTWRFRDTQLDNLTVINHQHLFHSVLSFSRGWKVTFLLLASSALYTSLKISVNTTFFKENFHLTRPGLPRLQYNFKNLILGAN